MLSLDRQNQYRERYRHSRPGWQPATEVYQAAIRARVSPGMHLLDVGCGRGGVLEQLGAQVTYPFGVDPDGRSLVEHRLANMPRAVALADHLPLKADTFDGVVCSWVLEHVADPKRVFAEVTRVLRPGGFFIFLTPNAWAMVTLINRTLRPMQHVLVSRLYGRAEADTFPVRYRANGRRPINRLAANVGLQAEQFYEIPDPTYLAFNPVLYSASRLIARVTPPVHLVGVYRRASA